MIPSCRAESVAIHKNHIIPIRKNVHAINISYTNEYVFLKYVDTYRLRAQSTFIQRSFVIQPVPSLHGATRNMKAGKRKASGKSISSCSLYDTYIAQSVTIIV